MYINTIYEKMCAKHKQTSTTGLQGPDFTGGTKEMCRIKHVCERPRLP